VDPYPYYGDVVVRFLSVLVVLVSFLLSATVDAQVLCATKTGLVNLRTACKTREKVVDLASLGPTGPQGIQGEIGATGTNGTNGSNGTDGKTVLSGTGAPTTQGISGDFYVDTAANRIYGPKVGSSWGSGVSLVGPQGIQGIQGPIGLTGATGATGASGQNGASLNAYDAYGNNLGKVVSAVNWSVSVYDTSSNEIYTINTAPVIGMSQSPDKLFLKTTEVNRYVFSDSNCSSSPLVLWTGQSSLYVQQPNDINGVYATFLSAYSEVDGEYGSYVPTGRIVNLGSLVDHSVNTTSSPVVTSGVIIGSIRGVLEESGQMQRTYSYYLPGSLSQMTGNYVEHIYVMRDDGDGCIALSVTTPPSTPPAYPTETGSCNTEASCNITYAYNGITSDAVTAYNSYAADLDVYRRNTILYSQYASNNYIPSGGNRWLFNVATKQVPFSIPIQGPITLK
jgi:hypothetical protein